MPVEIKYVTKEYLIKETGKIAKKRVPVRIWHMPDGLPDELPPAEKMDTEACLRLVGVLLHDKAEMLKDLYDYRKHRKWRNYADNSKKVAKLKAANAHLIKETENIFYDDFFCTGVNGEAVVDSCRREVYGKKWKEHRDFQPKEKPTA